MSLSLRRGPWTGRANSDIRGDALDFLANHRVPFRAGRSLSKCLFQVLSAPGLGDEYSLSRLIHPYPYGAES